MVHTISKMTSFTVPFSPFLALSAAKIIETMLERGFVKQHQFLPAWLPFFCFKKVSFISGGIEFVTRCRDRLCCRPYDGL